MAASHSIPSTIRALRTQGDKTVKVETIAFNPTLAPNEILVRVRAVGLNPTDWKSASRVTTAGLVSGCDAAGDVVAVGSDVAYFQVGDRAGGFAWGASSSDNGGFSEYVRLDSTVSFKLAPGMSYEEGASIPIPNFTAVLALYLRLSLPAPSSAPSKGDKSILIWGGSTAVGHHAIQLAVLSGLRVFTTGSVSAHSELLALGASQVFDYKDPDVASKIKAAAGEPGITYALDCVSEKGTTDLTIDSIGSSGGSVVILLPVSDETNARRADVKVIHILLYLVLGPLGKFPFHPEDRDPLRNFLHQELPALLEGWKSGAGSAQLKPQRLRKLEGGLEGIPEGLSIMQNGNYGREKLVYEIA